MAGSASNTVEDRIANGFFRGQSIVVPNRYYAYWYVYYNHYLT